MEFEVQKYTQSMSYYLTNNSVQQMPKVTSPGAFDRKLFSQLTVNRLNQPAFAIQSFSSRFRQGAADFLVSTEGRMKIDPTALPQSLLQRLRAIALICQHPTVMISFQQILNKVYIVDTGWSQDSAFDHAQSGHFQMQAIPEVCSPKPLTVSGTAFEQVGPFGPDEFTYFHRHAVQNLKPVALMIVQIDKKHFLDLPEVSRLADKVASVGHLWKEALPVPFEVLIDVFVSVISKVFSDDFHGDYLAVSQFWQKSSGAKFSSLGMLFAKIINNYEGFDDKISEIHFGPPCPMKKVASLSSAKRAFFIDVLQKSRTRR